MPNRGFFVASTGQNIGKTTLCLGLLAGLGRYTKPVGYMKPVGQEHIEIKPHLHVDKDVVLVKEHFHIQDSYTDMSPVIIPKGFTKDFLDGKIHTQDLIQKIQQSYQRLKQELIVVEGTGHVGVGSIIGLNNAEVAKHLGLPMILIASGGLGSAFDELNANRILCKHHDVPILGVILNRVKPEKRSMIQHYMQKALSRWDLPLIGCIPHDPLLETPSFRDFEILLQGTIIAGEEKKLSHFSHIRLIATSVELYRETIASDQLLITPANREDIILATLSKYWEVASSKQPLHIGMIVTGDLPPRHFIIEELKKADIPTLYAPLHSYDVLEKINSSTAKIRQEDGEKIKEAINVVEKHIDFSLILGLLDSHPPRR